ncbi:MAG: autotransporter outer membrane beta-barrel domain-containing protein [Cloacibacillus evryensis]
MHAGAWKYALVKETDSSGSEWYLKRGDKLSLMGEDGLTPTGKAIAAAAFMYDTWHTEAGTLTKRMGIYRDGLWKGGLWAEAALSRVGLGYDGLRGASDRRKFKTAAIGYDRRIENRGAIFWYGVMAGYGKDDIDVPFGKKELKSTYAALYGVSPLRRAVSERSGQIQPLRLKTRRYEPRRFQPQGARARKR